MGPQPRGLFSLALGLKLIPVVARQQRNLLHLLKGLPAHRFLVTGARQAMVRRKSIERREKAALYSFAEEQGFTVLSTFETATETGLLLGTS